MAVQGLACGVELGGVGLQGGLEEGGPARGGPAGLGLGGRTCKGGFLCYVRTRAHASKQPCISYTRNGITISYRFERPRSRTRTGALPSRHRHHHPGPASLSPPTQNMAPSLRHRTSALLLLLLSAVFRAGRAATSSYSPSLYARIAYNRGVVPQASAPLFSAGSALLLRNSSVLQSIGTGMLTPSQAALFEDVVSGVGAADPADYADYGVVRPAR